VGALEPKFFARLCELLGQPALAARQYGDDQETLAAEVARVFSSETLEHWLLVLDGEDVCVGPVATLAEAADDLGTPARGRAPALGAHTESWRQELGL
jgi:crotonobetainyl-CoA:carnitine CoA-transferase CaiB-like acyl-CoA transferase